MSLLQEVFLFLFSVYKLKFREMTALTISIDEVLCLGNERNVKSDVVRPSPDLIQRQRLDVERRCLLDIT